MVRADTIEDLQEAWPEWKIWRTTGGTWMATRRRDLTMEEMRERLAHTLMEDGAEQLLAQLREQAELAKALA